MHVAAWHCRTPETKFTKLGEEMSIGHTPNVQHFVAIWQEIRDIRDQKFVLPKKLAKIHQNRLRPAIP